jgi:hypothetical protein
MSIEKRDRNYVVRFIAPLLQGFLVFLPLTLVVFILWKPAHWLFEVVCFCIVLVAALALGAWLFIRFFRHYRCPQCQAELPVYRDAKLVSNRRFYCKSCDVIWQTGLEDGGGSYPT